MQAIICCYLWDLLDEGVGAVVDRMAGEIGAAGVCVPATYRSIDQVRPHEAVPTHRYRHDAATYFQPDRRRYASTRVRAPVAGWLGRRNPLSDVCQVARAGGLAVHLWVAACHGSTLANRHPWAAGKDAFGAPLDAGLCPSNPDVRQYVCELVGDLSDNYPADSIVLDSAFYPSRHGHAHEQSGLEPGFVEAFLSGLCFCESCRQRAIDAGVDVEPVVRSVRVALDRWYSSGRCEAGDVATYLRRETLLAEYVSMRCRVVTEWTNRLRSCCSCRLVYHLPPCPEAVGVDAALLADQVERFLITLDDADTRTAEDGLAQHSTVPGARAGSPAFRVHAYPPWCPDAPSLVRTLAGLAQRGVAQAYLENYGLIPAERLNWLRQAIRTAGRAGG